MDTNRIDRLFAAGLLLLGVYIVWKALEYGYMRDATPGAGFFPFWVGLGLAALSAVNLVRSARGVERLDSVFDRAGVYSTAGIIIAIVMFIVITPWFGMLAASAFLVLAVAFAIRPRWTRTFAMTILAIAAAFPVISYFIFGVYLRVPLQRGLLGF